jgi:hypothetical protein
MADSNKTIAILSIDAWAEGENGWTWNQWFKVGECTLETCDLPEAEIIRFMINEGYLSEQAVEGCVVDDDQYNVVICDAETLEPLFALEYGAVVY